MTARRTRCPQGRPLYRFDDLPDTLATASMLRGRRRRLADGQQPAASYWTGYQYVPLYRIADAIALPPLTGKRLAYWQQVRTCARCGTGYADPLPFATGPLLRRRLCLVPCCRAEVRAQMLTRWLAARMAAQKWATDVAADQAAVLVDVSAESGLQPAYAHAATIAGEVLVDTAYPTPDLQVLRPLTGRRLITWWSMHPLYPWCRDPDIGPARPGQDRAGEPRFWKIVPSVVESDRFADRYRSWLMREGGDPGSWPAAGTRLHLPTLRDGERPVDVVATMRDSILNMAAGTHPDGPTPGCPQLPDTGLQPCGRPIAVSGLCAGHAGT